MANKSNIIVEAWRKFRNALGTAVNRDTSMMNIAQQCLVLIDQYNMQLHQPPAGADGMPEDQAMPEGDMPEGEDGGMMGMMGMDADCHWFQDIYQGNDGSLFCITNAGGKLFKWMITTDPSGTVALGDPTPVQSVFSTAQEKTLSNIQKRTDGRYEGFAILGSCALNKDGEIDSRQLFDTFVDRFTGVNEYVNIYHLGKDKTKIGVLDLIFREGNLLVGHYVLDDNPVANAAGATLAADTLGEWGGSIEFWSDDEGTQIEVAQGVKANVYTSGTLEGFSIATAFHGAAWGTAHYMTRTPDPMNDVTMAAVKKLLGNDPAALEQFQGWLDQGNLRLSGSITRTQEGTPDQPTEVTQEATPVEQAAPMPPADMPAEGGSADGNPPSIQVDDKLLAAVVSAIQGSDWFKTLLADQQALTSRVADLEQIVQGLQTTSQTVTDQAQAATDQVQTVSADLGARVEAAEAVVQQLASFYERSKPPAVQVATYRPGSQVPAQATGAKPPPVTTVTQTTAINGQQPKPATNLQSLWKRPKGFDDVKPKRK